MAPGPHIAGRGEQRVGAILDGSARPRGRVGARDLHRSGRVGGTVDRRQSHDPAAVAWVDRHELLAVRSFGSDQRRHPERELGIEDRAGRQ